MSAIASIEDGKVVNNASTTEAVNKSKGNSSMDKDMFLQLLVAQMKYQDPMEPTSNTEYVAQYATFSQVEQLQNMSSTVSSTSAMQLVGKYVTMDVDLNGSTSTISGRVDYVEKSGSKTLLYIDGTPYNYDNLNTVWDDQYLEAFNLCESWSKAVQALPGISDISLDYENAVANLRNVYDSMTDYQKGFIGESLKQRLLEAENQISVLKAVAQKAEDADKDTEADTEADSEVEAVEENDA